MVQGGFKNDTKMQMGIYIIDPVGFPRRPLVAHRDILTRPRTHAHAYWG